MTIPARTAVPTTPAAAIPTIPAVLTPPEVEAALVVAAAAEATVPLAAIVLLTVATASVADVVGDRTFVRLVAEVCATSQGKISYTPLALFERSIPWVW